MAGKTPTNEKKPRQRAKKSTEERVSLTDYESWFTNFPDFFRKSPSGVAVTSDTALGLSAYFACIRNISVDFGKIPKGVYQSEGNSRYERFNHPVQLVLDDPNDEMSPIDLFQSWSAGALGWHGGFAEIVRNKSGVVQNIYPLVPMDVEIKRISGQVRYIVKNNEVPGQAVIFEPRDILHIHGLGLDGITQGCIATLANSSFSAALAAQDFSAEFFGNGAVTSGILKIPTALKPEAQDRLRKSFEERYQGNKHHYRPIILEQGLEYVPTSNDPQKSQLIETHQFYVEDVCRWFRMPLHKVMHLLRATFSNIEQQDIEYVNDCLMEWVIKGEQELTRKLLTKQERQNGYRIKLNTKVLLRGDTKARSDFYTAMFNVGALSSNEIRAYEEENPIGPEGDVYFCTAQVQPLDLTKRMPETNTDSSAEDDSQDEDEDDSTDNSPDDENSVPSRTGTAFSQARQVVDAYESLLTNLLNKQLRIEINKFKQATKRGNLEQFADIFFREEVEVILGAEFKQLFNAMAISLSALTRKSAGNAAEIAAKDAVLRHISASKLCAESDNWPENRAENEAKTEINALADALLG